jgi:hypothetical protein|tara:strand:- start:6517 stop:7260 length:744 start_codon:yes stop_codon:yes gene_type:complete
MRKEDLDALFDDLEVDIDVDGIVEVVRKELEEDRVTEELAMVAAEKAAERESLRGEPGEDGEDGKDGEDGEDGKDGKDGDHGEDGKDGHDGEDGEDGKDGDDGVGIKKAYVNSEHHLTIELTSGKIIDTGYVRGSATLSGKGGRVTGGYSGGGGYVNKPSGIVELDFGISNKVASVVVTGVGPIVQNSVVLASMRIEETEDHPVDDLLIDPIRVAVSSLVIGTGFTVHGAMDNAPANGKYKVQWALG